MGSEAWKDPIVEEISEIRKEAKERSLTRILKEQWTALDVK